MATLNIQQGVDSIIKMTILKEDKSNADELNITLPNSFTVNVADTMNIKDTQGITIFTGFVQSVKTGSGVKDAKVFDLGSQLLFRTVNQIFTDQLPEEIIETILTTYTNLTYVSTITSTTPIASYVAKEKLAWDVIQEMAEILLANFRVDVNGSFYLEREGEDLSPKAISTSNALLDGKWEEDTTQLVNNVIVIGDQQIFNTTENFGSGSTIITLTNTPIDIRVENPIGTLKQGYVDGASTGDYQVDRENKLVVFDTAPASGTVSVIYTYPVPIKVTLKNSVSIAAYRQRDRRFEKNYIKSFNEARDFAAYINEKFSSPLKSSTWVMTSNTDYLDFNSFAPNNVIPVNDNLRNINGNFIIKKVQYEYPGSLSVQVGEPTQDFVSVQKESIVRIKQLEEKDNNATTLQEYQTLEQNVGVSIGVYINTFESRPIGNYFYLQETIANSNSNNLLGGTALLGDEGTLMQTWTSIIPASLFPLRLPFTLGSD